MDVPPPTDHAAALDGSNSLCASYQSSRTSLYTLIGTSGVLTNGGSTATFFGATGVVGRGIILEADGQVVCGVVPYPEEPVRAIAQLFGPVVVGTVLFQELPNVPDSTTAVRPPRLRVDLEIIRFA